ncbi:MAG TPA: adenylate/guanylate cyclase domain-containing protein [Chitinophagales bacterium]|nr:adenylate/guanylate cyclase domain-containing protein [Chitinophagales bacterium]
MGKFYACILLLLLAPAFSRAQDKTQVDTLNVSAESLLNQNPRAGIAAASKAREMAGQIGYNQGLGYATALLGVAHFKVDEYDTAQALLNKAADLSKKSGDTSTLAFSRYWTGIIQLNKGEYGKALDMFQRAYELSLATGDKKNLARSTDGKASIYDALNENEKALELYQKALAIAHEANFKEYYPLAMFAQGSLAYKKGNFDEAIAKYNEAIKLSDEVGNINNKASCYQNLATIYYQRKQSKDAMKYIQEAMNLFQKTGSASSFSHSRLMMCYILLNDHEYDLVINFAKMSMDEGKASGELELQKDAAELLYYAYLSKGDKAMALDYHIKFHNLAEASHNEEIAKKLARMDLEANFQKEREIAKAEQEKRDAEMNAQIDRQKLVKKVSIIGIFLFAVIAGLAVYAFNQKRKDSSLIAEEKSHTDELLYSVLPEEVVEEIKKEHKVSFLATVLFADFKSYRHQGDEKLPAPQPMDIDRYFKAFDDIVARKKLEKIKTAGDAYLCVGTQQADDKENAAAVVSAALEMQDYVKQLKAQKKSEGQAFVEVSIGIHSGPMTAGIIGIRRLSHDVWGDVVNAAARVEQYGEGGRISISAATYELVKDRFICLQHGEIEIRRRVKTDMYFVEGVV